jgi:hypothetical protein
LTFAPGETSASITIQTLEDAIHEGYETFRVTLTPGEGCTLGPCSEAVVTVEDDDESGIVEFNTDVFSVAEGTARATIMVRRTRNTAGAASVTWSVSNNTATLGVDGSAEGGTLTLLAGETSKSFTVDIVDDALAEGHESFYLELSSPSESTMLGAQFRSVLVVTDNDVADGGFKMNAASYVRQEPGTSSTVTITISRGKANKNLSQTVYFTASSGTASAGGDFASLTSLAVSFAPGALSKAVTVQLVGDSLVEGNESLNLELTDASNGATLAAGRRAVIVVEDDDLPAVLAKVAPDAATVTARAGDRPPRSLAGRRRGR